MDKQLAEALAHMELTRKNSPASRGLNQINPQGSVQNGGRSGQTGPSTAASQLGDTTFGCQYSVGGVGINQEGGGGAFSQIFPMLQGYINQDAALACRVVCKDWKQGVDETLSGSSSQSSSNSGSHTK